MLAAPFARPGRLRRGFTLVELLVVLAIIALVTSVAVVSTGAVRRTAHSVQTMSDLRALGMFAIERAVANGGTMPRSRHSALNFAHPERAQELWGLQYFQYVGAPGNYASTADRAAFINRWLRSPFDDRTDAQEGYALSVYFELRGAGDEDGPAETADGRSWRRMSSASAPASTVVFGETWVPDQTQQGTPQPRDHFMAHFWAQLDSDTSHEVRNRPATAPPVFAFLDGHSEATEFESTFRRSPEGGPPTVDRWNPATAGRSPLTP